MAKVDGITGSGYAAGYSTSTGTTDSEVTTARYGETRLADIAARLGVSVESLLQANPQIVNPNSLKAGQDIQLPQNDVPTDGGSPAEAGTPDPTTPDPTPASASPDSRRGDPMARSMAQWRFAAGGGGSMAVATPSGSAAGAADAAAPADSRFDAVNGALHAGDGPEAMEAAKQLLITLQKEKPPQPKLMDQARMSLAAAAMLAGDLDTSTNAILSIHPQMLDAASKEQYNGLRDLVKGARQDAYSAAMPSDGDPDANGGGNVQDHGKTAADEAGKLVDFLQKTDPGNSTEINQARLKQANALLMGNHYREAGKALNGVQEKQLAPDQKQYFGAIQDEMHAQQIDALGGSYQSDMKSKRYKDAVSDSTALVNDLAKNFPESKGRLASARMQQATAQIMNGEMEGARKTLGHVSPDDLQQLPKGMQENYRQLTGAVTEHFETQKKLDALKADQAAVAGQVKTIGGLMASGNKADAAKAVPLGEQLVATVQQKFGDNAGAIADAKLTLANAKLAAGDIDGAKTQLQAIADSTKDPAIQNQVQLVQARVALREGHTDQGMQMLHSLSESGATPEVRQTAKGVIISIESSNLKNVARKADLESDQLNKIKEGKTAKDDAWYRAFNPFNLSNPGVVDEHVMHMNDLNVMSMGASDLQAAMKKNNLTLAEISKLDFKSLAGLQGVGEQNAREIQRALANPDVQLIAKDSFQSKRFSWETNTLYVDPSYLDTGLEMASKWIGDKVRTARSYDEELKSSDSIFDRAVGYTSGAILDAVSTSNQFIKEKIQTATDFYNDPERKDTWYAKLGRAGTFGADMLSSTFTMPATIADYKATDQERAGAMFGSLVMLGTAGILKSGGPSWVAGRISGGASKLASSRVGQWLANSEFGQFAANSAQKLAQTAGKIETKFEGTSFAKGVDRVKDAIDKLNPDITLGGAAKGGGLAIHPDMPNVMIDSSIAGADMNSLLSELERTPTGSRIADRIRSGELHLTITREPLAGTADGLATGNEMQATWGGSTQETASTIIHEGTHNLDPAAMPDGRPVSTLSREAIARSEEFEYRAKAGLKPYDATEVAYRDAFQKATAGGATQAEAQLAADKAMIDVLRTDPVYGAGQGTPVNLSQRVGGTATMPAKSVDQTVDEVVQGRTPAELRDSVTPDEMTKMRGQFEKDYREYWQDRGVEDPPPSDISDKQIRRMVLGDKIYFENYNPVGAPKQAGITQGAYESDFAKYDGPTKTNGNWHIRANKPSPGATSINQDWLDGDVRRMYFNVQPDKAVDLADYVSGQLNQKGIPFQFKIPSKLENFNRADAGVLLVEPANYPEVKKLVLEYADKHPEAFADGSPAFTKPLGKGVSAADEPAQGFLPARVGKVSFGESRSDIVAEAILDAPANASQDEIQQLVRQRLQHYGFDPDRPWLKQRAKADDL